jgi:hypothetical protein
MRPKGDDRPELILTGAEAALYARMEQQAALLPLAEREEAERQRSRMFTHMVAARLG